MPDYSSRVYMDVDGVLNPLKKPDPSHKGGFLSGDIRINQGAGLATVYHMTWAPEVIQAIDTLREEANMELVWLSSWNQDFHVRRLSQLWRGLYGGRILPFTGTNEPGLTMREFNAWKADAILEDMETDPVPFAWMDDLAVKFHSARVSASHPDATMFDVHGGKGLSATDLMLLKAFAHAATKF